MLSNNQPVAIKHIINEGNVETFVREVTSLSHIRHPNLVALLGCCVEEDECFLVYELCPNGSLSEWLFGIILSLHPLSFCFLKCTFIYVNEYGSAKNQEKVRSYPGLKDLKLQSIVLEVYGFSTHIQRAALFTEISRSVQT